ncbi:hypothetical protein [Streptomyces sp. 184]|uniref:hypothetical protein n=1 Tax=Streptomyces sp. 184 TaxID=1827526 RepID=UPI0038912269
MVKNSAGNLRYIIGAILVLLGAVGVVWSAWRPWYNGRDGRQYALDDVFDGITDAGVQLFASIFLPMAVAALLAVLGILMRSRLLVVLGALLVLFITVLWMIRQSQVSDGLKVNSQGTGLDVGTANAVIGAALMLIGAAVWGNQRRRRAIPHPVDETTPGPDRSGSSAAYPRHGEQDAPDDHRQDPPRAA